MAAGLLFCMVFFVSSNHPVPWVLNGADARFQDHYVLRFRVRLYQPHRPLQQAEPGMLN